MQITKKKKTEDKSALGHGLYLGRVKGAVQANRGKDARLEIEFPGFKKTLTLEIPDQYDEETESGHRIAALLGGPIPDELTLEALTDQRAFFVVVLNRTAGGKPQEEIATVLSVRMLNQALAQMAIGTAPEKPRVSLPEARG